MTKFIDNTIKREPKKTVFTRIVLSDFRIEKTNASFFNHYEVVEHIGFDQNYGDVFKAYKKRNNKNFFTILFGTKGDEFNNLTSYKKETAFLKVVTNTGSSMSTDQRPCDFEIIEYLGKDSGYGDVFKAYKNKNDPDHFTIFLGKKGDEFNQE